MDGSSSRIASVRALPLPGYRDLRETPPPVEAVPVSRPIWRRFAPRFFDRAAAHARRGGHSAVVHDGLTKRECRVDLLLPTDATGKITELALWSLLAIEQRRWRRVRDGAAKGLATARAHREFEAVVLDWCERDAVHAGPRRRVRFDCLACAACCRDNDLHIEPGDELKWRLAGRVDLLRRGSYRRGRDGKLRLKLAKDGRCPHLERDNRCRIYSLRPSNCSVFPVASEACLAAREDTLGLRDG
jgi:hypothetical protein